MMQLLNDESGSFDMQPHHSGIPQDAHVTTTILTIHVGQEHRLWSRESRRSNGNTSEFERQL